MKNLSEKASIALNKFTPVPQLLKNVRFEAGRLSAAGILDFENVRDALRAANEKLAGEGRILVRPSGTEPVIRVMAEGDDQKQVEDIVGTLCSVIDNAAKSA